MKSFPCFLLLACLLASAAAARAGDTGTAACGPNDDYVTLYYSLDTFEMGGRLACGSKLAVLDEQKTYAAQRAPYVRVETADGKLGYVARSAIVIVYSAGPPSPVAAPITAPSAKSATRGRATAVPASVPAAAPPLAAVPASVAATTAPANPPSEMPIADGTEVEVKLSADLSSERTSEGALVDFTVVQPLIVNGVTVFEGGAPARARVIQLKKAARFGHEGEIYWAMQDVTAVDGTRVPARFVAEAQDTTASGLAVGILAASGNSMLVEQSSFSLHRGDVAFVPAGQIFKVLIHGNTLIHLSPVAAAH
jgi:hypothetical protein